jgi:hypothetical protein
LYPAIVQYLQPQESTNRPDLPSVMQTAKARMV